MDDDLFTSIIGFLFIAAIFGCGSLYFAGKGVLFNRQNDGFTTICYYWTPFSTIEFPYGDGDNGVYCPRLMELAR